MCYIIFKYYKFYIKYELKCFIRFFITLRIIKIENVYYMLMS